eukprot:tig00021352_g20683.t1
MAARAALALLALLALGAAAAADEGAADTAADGSGEAVALQASDAIYSFFGQSASVNNWAVIVCTSRFWFNYRHVANALSIYYTVKRLGIPDSQIILMLSDDMACNARNGRFGEIFNDDAHSLNLYTDDAEVDYRGYDVTVENFVRLIQGRHTADVPRSKRLLTDRHSKVLLFMTGHGGDEFLKFQDVEEIHSWDIADALEQARQAGRYGEVLFVSDTCQAATLAKHMYSPGVLSIGSSQLGQSSYSYNNDARLGLSTVDRFTYHTLNFFSSVNIDSRDTLAQLFTSYDPGFLHSTPEYRTDLYPRRIDQVLVTEFFGSVTSLEIMPFAYPARPAPAPPRPRAHAGGLFSGPTVFAMCAVAALALGPELLAYLRTAAADFKALADPGPKLPH